MNIEFTSLVYPLSRRRLDSYQIGWHTSDGLNGRLFRDSVFTYLSYIDACQKQKGLRLVYKRSRGVFAVQF